MKIEVPVGDVDGLIAHAATSVRNGFEVYLESWPESRKDGLRKAYDDSFIVFSCVLDEIANRYRKKEAHANAWDDLVMSVNSATLFYMSSISENTKVR